MKKQIRENINSAFTLHDRTVTAIGIIGSNIIMRTQSGIFETTSPYRLLDGYVEFRNVQMDFSYVYVLDIAGNVGEFTGKKMFLKDFIVQYRDLKLSVMDETYGYNLTKYAGFLLENQQRYECIIEIYHEGDMVFVVEE